MQLKQVYSHHPWEKPYWKEFFYSGLENFSDVSMEQWWLNALPNVPNGLSRDADLVFTELLHTLTPALPNSPNWEYNN